MFGKLRLKANEVFFAEEIKILLSKDRKFLKEKGYVLLCCSESFPSLLRLEMFSSVEDSTQTVTTKQILSNRSIKRLDKDVSDRIAAGEVILRPASVVKELLENSIDAQATRIEVSLLDGGLKTIRFKDDGEGIHPDDLNLLCERFATSKMTKYEDLLSIGTFGFRGEALASISFVSHLTVTTMKENSDFAHQAYFENGRLVPSDILGASNPKKCSGVKGTTFIVEDLFYNCPLRRRSLSNSKEEYRFIIDLLMKYSIRYPSVSFSCRRLENAKYDFFTPSVDSELASIGNVYGKELTEELLEVGPLCTSFSFHGYISNANFSLRRPQYLFFVNGRLIEWQSLKKAISSLYNSLLPKGGHPFIYIDVTIDPHRLDVNVHPAKRQICILDEEYIIEKLLHSIETKLTMTSSSRNFYTVSLRDTSYRGSIESFASHLEKYTLDCQSLSERKRGESSRSEGSNFGSELHAAVQPSLSGTPSKERRPYKKVRTSILQSSSSLDSFLATKASSGTNLASEDKVVQEGSPTQNDASTLPQSNSSDNFFSNDVELDLAVDEDVFHKWNRKSLVFFLRERVELLEKDCNAGLKKMLNESCFIGSVDEDHILVQYQTKLFWLNLTHLSKRMLFQKSLKMIQRFDSVFIPKISVFQSVLRHINNPIEKYELQQEHHYEIVKEEISSRTFR
ncbi:DNA mismatch repair protein Mlh1 [Galdieria sulphuraria]|nr:DNA mismatch repair protein Mlh1 [Galdieria sulphuraria]